MKYSGLTVKGGRLINERPNGMTGIQEAAMIRKAQKIKEKSDVIALGVMKGDMGEDKMESIGKYKED